MPVKQIVQQLSGHSFTRLQHWQQVAPNSPSDTGTKERGCLWGKWKEQQQLIVIKSLSAVAIKLQWKKGQMLFFYPDFSLAHFLSKQQAE